MLKKLFSPEFYTRPTPEQMMLHTVATRRKLEGPIAVSVGKGMFATMFSESVESIKSKMANWSERIDFLGHVQAHIPEGTKQEIAHIERDGKLRLDEVISADAHNLYVDSVVGQTHVHEDSSSLESMELSQFIEPTPSRTERSDRVWKAREILSKVESPTVHDEFLPDNSQHQSEMTGM